MKKTSKSDKRNRWVTCNNKKTYVAAEWDDLNCTCNVDVITFPSSKILNILLQQSNLFQEKILWL